MSLWFAKRNPLMNCYRLFQLNSQRVSRNFMGNQSNEVIHKHKASSVKENLHTHQINVWRAITFQICGSGRLLNYHYMTPRLQRSFCGCSQFLDVFRDSWKCFKLMDIIWKVLVFCDFWICLFLEVFCDLWMCFYSYKYFCSFYLALLTFELSKSALWFLDVLLFLFLQEYFVITGSVLWFLKVFCPYEPPYGAQNNTIQVAIFFP